jgi:hypothetical protein
MYVCKQCNYTTRLPCNWVRHQNRKRPCGSNPPDEPFKRIDEKTIQCNACEKMLHTHYGRHAQRCKGVPLNTCKYCKRHFNAQSTHSQHQTTCKAKPENTNIHKDLTRIAVEECRQFCIEHDIDRDKLMYKTVNLDVGMCKQFKHRMYDAWSRQGYHGYHLTKDINASHIRSFFNGVLEDHKSPDVLTFINDNGP